jgi:tripartite-type tricarboxylate transporter receptor subunit TctC
LLKEEDFMKARIFARSLAPTAAFVCLTLVSAKADPVEDFYRGRTLEMTVPGSSGGDYDRRARIVSRHLGRLIPGGPQVVVKNMPGGIGLQAANHLANTASRDGTSMTIVFQNMPVLQAIGSPAVQFDARKFGWLGNTTNSPNVINSWHTTGITRIDQVFTTELVVGASGVSSTGYVYPAAMNQVLGTKFRIVGGYPGGNEINLAMERGEVGGRGSNSWASWKSNHPHWIAEKKINILVQVGLTRAPDLKDVPLMLELAKNEEDKQVLTFLSSDMGIARAFATTPDTPQDRLRALRTAFMGVMKDPIFLAEAKKQQMDIEPTGHEEVQRVVESMINASPAVIARARALLAPSGK